MQIIDFHSWISRVAIGVKAKIYFAPWPKMRARAEKGSVDRGAVENVKSGVTSNERGGALETRNVEVIGDQPVVVFFVEVRDEIVPSCMGIIS